MNVEQPKPASQRKLREDPEFQSALVRLSIWLFAVGYIGLAASRGHYVVDMTGFAALFAIYLVIFVGLFISVVRRPAWTPRRYLSLIVDISASSFAIYLTDDALSPFYLLYIWIFVSYGTRYGKNFLFVGSVGCIIGFSIVLTVLGQWGRYGFEVTFLMILLAVLPFYEYSLLKKLHRARLIAESADRVKGNLMVTLKRDMGTPFRSMMSMADSLKHSRLNDQQRECLDTLVASAEVIKAFMGDLSDLPALDEKTLEINARDFNCAELILDVCKVLNVLALDKKVDLLCMIDADFPRIVNGDEKRTRQVLFNLLGYAIKTTSKGQVSVHVSPLSNGQAARIRIVEDSSKMTDWQLSPEQERYMRAEDGYASPHSGIGVGLSIAHSLIHLMGGTLEIEMRRSGGHRVTIEIPFSANKLASPRLRSLSRSVRVFVLEPNKDMRDVLATYANAIGLDLYFADNVHDGDNGEEFEMALIGDSASGVELEACAHTVRARFGESMPLIFTGYPQRRMRQPVEGPAVQLAKPFDAWALLDAVKRLLTTPELEKMAETGRFARIAWPERLNVLVAEDDVVGARMIAALLEKRGHHVVSVSNGVEALELVDEDDKFDLVLADLRMPGLDGLTFAARFRERWPGSKMKIIGLATHYTGQVADSARRAGMDSIVSKPLTADTLDRVLETVNTQVAEPPYPT